jgi:thioesterase domain-containing protein
VEIVRLQDGDSSASAYCLPTSTGAVHDYFELAKAIGPGHLIYGIQIADRVQNKKFKEFSSLREMVTAMLPEFLAHHRDGPICLIGYSFAAYLAIELAQQLIGLGKTVPLVVIIGGKPPSASFTPFLRMKHFIRYLGPWALNVATRAVTDTHYRFTYYHKMAGSSWYANLPEDLQDYIKKNIANSRNYLFEGVYRNKILLFRSTKDAHPLRGGPGEDFGWGDITGASVDVVHTAGYHHYMMQKPTVVHIANKLRPLLGDCELSRYR